MADGDRLADPGAQLERTSLAWSRTAFAVAACGALVVRQGFVDDLVALVASGVAVLVLSGLIWLLASVRYSVARNGHRRHLLAGHRYAVRALTALVVLVSCAAAVGSVAAALS